MPYKDKRRQTENAIKWAKDNPERFHANQKRYRQRHPKGMADKSKRWRVANPEKVRINLKRYRSSVRCRYLACKRNHVIRGLPFNSTQEEYGVADLLKNCAICSRELIGRKVWESDYHAFVHLRCNTIKGPMNKEEFEKFISDVYELVCLVHPKLDVPSISV